MASAFTHAFSAVMFGSFRSGKKAWKFWLLGILCSILPDADVAMFAFVPYEHWLGHRGFFHSFFFSAIVAIVFNALFYRDLKVFSKQWWGMALYFFVCTASHGILDALTTGGLGVAFFAPFDNTRYFFPDAWRKIRVSPIGAGAFFSEWGIRVIKSELLWVWLPGGIVMALVYGVRKLRGQKDA